MANDKGQMAGGSDADWEVAEARADVFRRLLAMSDLRERSRIAVLAMQELAISRATFYRLLARFRAARGHFGGFAGTIWTKRRVALP